MSHDNFTQKRDAYLAKMRLAEAYQEGLQSTMMVDLMNWVNREYTDTQNKLLLEPSQREVSTDALRGRMQFMSSLYNRIKIVLSQGEAASKQLAKLQENEQNGY